MARVLNLRVGKSLRTQTGAVQAMVYWGVPFAGDNSSPLTWCKTFAIM